MIGIIVGGPTILFENIIYEHHFFFIAQAKVSEAGETSA